MVIIRWTLCFALLVITGCQSGNRFRIHIQVNTTDYDTLFLRELITGRILAKVPLHRWNSDHVFRIDEMTVGAFTTRGSDSEYLTIIRPGSRKVIRIDASGIQTLQAVPDSLLNYLWHSTNAMFSQHGYVIFAQDNPVKVKSLFDSLIVTRQQQLIKFRDQLTESEYGMLDYQNKARAYAFLMFYGRVIKNYPPQDEFFDFIDRIENDPVFTRSLPDNLLYKYEITYLREKDSIESLHDFLTYIESQTGDKDQAEFLKAIYLQDVIEHPMYWKKHAKLFTAPAIREALQRESASKYAFMIQKSSDSFFSSQKGMQAYDFTALRTDGTAIRMSDFRNKIVVMDVWATWCGPCIQQRPAMIELAKTYRDITDVVFLLVSVDRDAERWKKYVQQTNENQHGMDVIIPDDERETFSQKYLVSFIPKYIIIDRDGVIIDSQIPEPSLGMKQRIEGARAISESDDLK